MVRKGFQIKRAAESRWGRLLLLALSGIATGLTLIFPQLGLFEWITLIPMGIVLYHLAFESQIKIRQAYGYGFYFFMSLYLVVYHWFIYLYPLDFTGMTPAAAVVVVIFAWVGLAILASVSGGLIFVFAVLAGRLEKIRRHRFLFALLVPALWVLFDWTQTQTFMGVPWGRLALGQVQMLPMIQTASVFGAYFISFLIVAVNICFALAFKRVFRVKLGVICACAIVLGNSLAGTLILTFDEKGEETLTAAVVQGNIASGDKWGTSINDIINIYAEYTYEAAAEEGVELVIWPETAIPVSIEIGSYAERIKDISKNCAKPILVGIFTETNGGALQNSLVLFHPDGRVDEQIYSKRHLVPFGEYVPLRKLLTTLVPPLTQIAMLSEDLIPGEDSGLVDLGGKVLGPLICFDSIYETLALDSARDGAEIMVLSTNDSWFYDSAAGRMHLAQASLRAVETDRAVFRAANTGISALIDSDGRVLEKIPALEGGYLVGELELSNEITPYVLFGNLFVIASALLSFCIFSYGIIGKSNRKK